MFGKKTFCNFLNANGVGSLLIVTDAIQARHINGMIFTAGMIGTNEINGRHIAPDSIQTSQMGTRAITTTNLATNAINGAKLAADSVDTSHLNTNAVNGVVIAALAVSSGHVKGTSLSLGRATHGVGFGKLNALVMSVPFGTQGVTAGVTHGLGQAAEGWFVIRQNKEATIFEKGNVATQLRLVATGIACTDIGVKVVVW